MSTQAGFDRFTGDDATSELLQQDEKVDALSALQVKDAYVRGEFIHQIIKANERGGNGRFMLSDDCDHVENLLSEGDNAAIRQAAVAGLGRDHAVVQSLGHENGPGNVETLFARFMNTDEFSDNELVAAARDQLKEALRGCGMPRINVMRDRVNYHVETSEAATGGEA